MNISPITGVYLTLLVSGCGGLHTTQPYAVARTCTPPYDMEVRGTVQGSDRRYEQTLEERCTQGPVGVEAYTRDVQTPYGVTSTHHEVSTTPDGRRTFSYREQAPGSYVSGARTETPFGSFSFHLQVGPQRSRHYRWR